MKAKKISCIAAGLFLLATPRGHAQELEMGSSETELAKQAQNPMAGLINIPIQNNFSFGYGPD